MTMTTTTSTVGERWCMPVYRVVGCTSRKVRSESGVFASDEATNAPAFHSVSWIPLSRDRS